GELGGEPLVLLLQVEALDRVLQHAAHFLRVPRLRDVAVDLPEVDRLDEHVDVGERGQNDSDRVGLPVAHPAKQLDARHLRHALVGDDDRDVLVLEDAERLGAARRRQDVERLPEVEPEGVEVVLLVVDDEDRIALHVERHDPLSTGITHALPGKVAPEAEAEIHACSASRRSSSASFASRTSKGPKMMPHAPKRATRRNIDASTISTGRCSLPRLASHGRAMLSIDAITTKPKIASPMPAPTRPVIASPAATGTHTIAVPNSGTIENISVMRPSGSACGTPSTRYAAVAANAGIMPAPITPNASPRPVSVNAWASRSSAFEPIGALSRAHRYQRCPSTSTA